MSNWLHRPGSGVVQQRWAGTSHAQKLSRRQGHDFDGGGWAQIQAVRSQYRGASAVPFFDGVGQSSGNMIQITMLTVDVAQKLKLNEGIKSVPG